MNKKREISEEEEITNKKRKISEEININPKINLINNNNIIQEEININQNIFNKEKEYTDDEIKDVFNLIISDLISNKEKEMIMYNKNNNITYKLENILLNFMIIKSYERFLFPLITKYTIFFDYYSNTLTNYLKKKPSLTELKNFLIKLLLNNNILKVNQTEAIIKYLKVYDFNRQNNSI